MESWLQSAITACKPQKASWDFRQGLKDVKRGIVMYQQGLHHLSNCLAWPVRICPVFVGRQFLLPGRLVCQVGGW